MQNNEVLHLGKFVAMSVTQGGGGFPFLAPPVYEYITTGKYTNIAVSTTDIPDMTLKFAVEKVQYIIMCTVCVCVWFACV